MRGAPLFLLLSLLCPPALSLKCYTCLEVQKLGGKCLESSCEGLTSGDVGVCYTSNLTVTPKDSGKQATTHFKGCAASCEVAQKAMEQLVKEETLHWAGPEVNIKLQGTKCCETNLCNGAPQVLTLSGPFLLCLASLLWALV